MDGEHRIMISDAINESDRLSSCTKRVRKKLASESGVFQVFRLEPAAKQDGAPEGSGEDLRLSYNVGGICLSEAGFAKLRREISLTPWAASLDNPGFNVPWVDKQTQFFVGTVPISNGVFRKIVIRKTRVAQVDVRDLSILEWTDRFYYEVCANPAVYAALPGEKSSAAKNS